MRGNKGKKEEKKAREGGIYGQKVKGRVRERKRDREKEIMNRLTSQAQTGTS